MEIPEFSIEPQRNHWNCMITAWHFATGISRDQIELDIGHDGGRRWASYEARMKAGETITTDDLLKHVGVFDAEMLWWAYKQKKRVITLTPFETVRDGLPESQLTERWHDKSHLPSRQQLFDEIQGKVAIIGTEIAPGFEIGHAVAWLGRLALDPQIPMPVPLAAARIRDVCILPEESAEARIAALKSDYLRRQQEEALKKAMQRSKAKEDKQP